MWTLRKALRVSLAAALLCALAPMAQAAEEGAPPSVDDLTMVRTYRVNHLNLHEAEVLIWDQCTAVGRERCFVRDSGVNEAGLFVAVFAAPAGHERIARALAQADVVPKTQVFQVVLVLADHGEGGNGQPLTPQATRALADVRDFLPYSRYQVVDRALVRTTRRADVVLHGADRLPLELGLSFQQRVGDKLYVDGLRVLRSASVPRQAGDDASLVSEGPRTLLETSFSMEVGETVVVGTSRLETPDQSDKALVVLLTASP